METHSEILNRFFVRVFNKILALEELALKDTNVSVSEIHIIEAVSELCTRGESTMKNIASRLYLSPGAVSVAVNTLVNKGYLRRENGERDRRKIYIFLTEKAEKAEKKHRLFHDRMIESIKNNLSEEELSALSRSLISLEEFLMQ